MKNQHRFPSRKLRHQKLNVLLQKPKHRDPIQVREADEVVTAVNAALDEEANEVDVAEAAPREVVIQMKMVSSLAY